jgi:hypothetical protein
MEQTMNNDAVYGILLTIAASAIVLYLIWRYTSRTSAPVPAGPAKHATEAPESQVTLMNRGRRLAGLIAVHPGPRPPRVGDWYQVGTYAHSSDFTATDAPVVDALPIWLSYDGVVAVGLPDGRQSLTMPSARVARAALTQIEAQIEALTPQPQPA